MKKILLWTLLGILIVMPMLVQAEDEPLAYVYSTGLIEEDGTVIYSVLLASGAEDLNNLTVTAEVPVAMTFIEGLELPESATLVGEADGVVTWEVEGLTANSILGPFSFSVQPTDKDIFIPDAIHATLTTDEGSAEAALSGDKLEPYATEGEIEIGPEGTLNEAGENVYVPIGDTGIWIFVLPETVTNTFTLTAHRLPLTDETVPQDVVDTWWCALVSFESDQPVSFNLPIGLILPTRRVLTPGLQVHMFAQNGTEWQAVPEASDEEAGTTCTTLANGMICTLFGLTGAPTTSSTYGIGFLVVEPNDSASIPHQGNFGGGNFNGGFQGGFQGGFNGGLQGGNGFNFGGGGFQGGFQGGFNGGGLQGGFQGGFNGAGGGGSSFGAGVNIEEREAGYVSSERLTEIGIESAIELLQFIDNAY